jgi:hypothetical protein
MKDEVWTEGSFFWGGKAVEVLWGWTELAYRVIMVQDDAGGLSTLTLQIHAVGGHTCRCYTSFVWLWGQPLFSGNAAAVLRDRLGFKSPEDLRLAICTT